MGSLNFANYSKRICLLFLFLNQNICFGYSKEPSQQDNSFEHRRHMFKLIDKEIITILRKKKKNKQKCLTGPMDFILSVLSADS